MIWTLQLTYKCWGILHDASYGLVTHVALSPSVTCVHSSVVEQPAGMWYVVGSIPAAHIVFVFLQVFCVYDRGRQWFSLNV